ncbi:dihydrofolate reductase [Candidatus Gracilibacteria bacterium]|nr:dihydrofolate reductase [Candidatus Gracilibacteria bacterium]
MKINLILAVDEKNGIGKNGTLAWNIKKDMTYFKNITSDTADLSKMNAVIMGRGTWDSIPARFRPLPNRINCILTRKIQNNNLDSKPDDFVLYFNSLEICLKELAKKENLENIFVIGGASLYNQLIYTDLIDKIYLTEVKGDFDCDTFFDGIPDYFTLRSATHFEKEGENEFRFCVYQKDEKILQETPTQSEVKIIDKYLNKKVKNEIQGVETDAHFFDEYK